MLALVGALLGSHLGELGGLLKKLRISVEGSIGPVLLEAQDLYSRQWSHGDTKGPTCCEIL